MRNKEPVLDDGEVEYEAGPESCWGNFEDDDVMHQQFSIQDDEAKKFPFVGDKVKLTGIIL
jgi:ubiquitin thioesterase protein OTUB1